MTNVEDNIFAAIDSGKAKMRPRWYFVLRGAFAVTGGVILLLFLLYFVSFIVFALHESGAWFTPDFGLSGWYVLFFSLPWLLIFLSLLFTMLLVLLVRQYSFVYHRPMLYILFTLVVVAVLGGVFVSATTLHRRVVNYAAENNLPFINGFYEFEEGTPANVHHGRIILFSGGGFVIQEAVGQETSTVIVLSTSSFGVGDSVVLIGERDASGTIHPIGIEKVGM